MINANNEISPLREFEIKVSVWQQQLPILAAPILHIKQSPMGTSHMGLSRRWVVIKIYEATLDILI